MRRSKAVEESWTQIGKLLRDARERAGLSVDDVVFKARIPRTVVDALEAEDFSVFTSPTYAKSFLRQYSDFLNVDAGPWLDALEPASYVSGEAWQPMFASGPPVGTSRESRRGTQEKVQPTGGNKWSTVWVMILTAGLVLAIMGGYRKFEEQFGRDEHPPAAEAAKQDTSPKAAAAPVAAPAAVISETPKKEEAPPPAPRAIIVRD